MSTLIIAGGYSFIVIVIGDRFVSAPAYLFEYLLKSGSADKANEQYYDDNSHYFGLILSKPFYQVHILTPNLSLPLLLKS
jgi:hypothetical protein